MNRKEHTELGWLALFTSTGTLICCALPILLVTLGFGAVVASLTNQFPLLITLSEYDGWMFGISAGFLGLTAWLIWGREERCPGSCGTLQAGQVLEPARLLECRNGLDHWFYRCIPAPAAPECAGDLRSGR